VCASSRSARVQSHTSCHTLLNASCRARNASTASGSNWLPLPSMMMPQLSLWATGSL